MSYPEMPEARMLPTPLGQLPTHPVPMYALSVGDHLVGEPVVRDGELTRPVYEVTGDCASHPRGWLFVRDLTRRPTDEEEEGGFFSYPTDTPMSRVLA